MIERLSGKVVACQGPKQITVSVGGVGYLVSIPESSGFILDQEVVVFVHTVFSQEKGFVLYGFESIYKRELFSALINCHKIGPQTALGILSNLANSTMVQKFVNCIAQGQEEMLVKQFKVGAKAANSIVAELQDKILKIGNLSNEFPVDQTITDAVDMSEIIQALRTMGYKEFEIMPAVKSICVLKNATQQDFAGTLKKVLSIISSSGK